MKGNIKANKVVQSQVVKDDNRPDDGVEDSSVKNDDPYLFKNAHYLNKESRWKNKQRVLVLSTRGINFRHRHLMEDIKKLLPHHKSEVKWEKKQPFSEITEVSELRSCNNILLFEARRHEELYMWVSKCPGGPSIKFQVLNIHTLGELKLAGNCLLGSRPLLSFDSAFDDVNYLYNVNFTEEQRHMKLPLKLIKDLFTQVFGTPRYHPKSKPFHDHVLSFNYLDGKIWFRHYQIAPDTEENHNHIDKQILIEIGPRFVLEPILILSKPFNGKLLYRNPDYKSPTLLRNIIKKGYSSEYLKRLNNRQKRSDYKEELDSSLLKVHEKKMQILRSDNVEDFE
ncbi:Brx1p nucleolar protein required for biogenesis of the 60S ribosomal subunit [Cryptosporidium ryanae]|uniref:Brx1p nucleolar protein required for biogenesis of the 60S ribosomal subunit n=1 Tax=Cryptosporidium ryanae TaxID=515981 RepID=UPI00351A59E5|nr:Brx1p nucleolar protein required for biogenesis of the 60S ribosomal subunit [Cryptosporidium ryanae]